VKNRIRFAAFRNARFRGRKFLAQTAAAAIGLSIVPRHVLGGTGYVPAQRQG